MRLRMICTDKSLVDGPGYLAAGLCYQVGRSSRCSFIVGDRSVSRHHAELAVSDLTVFVKDLGSRNGTFVDDVRIEEAEVLPGQWLRFGSALFQLLAQDASGDLAEDDSDLSTFFMRGKPVSHPEELRQLSKAQLAVIDLLLKGMKEKDVAEQLCLSQHTIHNHIKEVYRRMGVSSRPALLSLFVTKGKKEQST